MKYLINWHERPQGSAIEYENVQKRIMKIFQHWEIPSEVKVHAFVVRVSAPFGSLSAHAEPPTKLIRTLPMRKTDNVRMLNSSLSFEMANLANYHV